MTLVWIFYGGQGWRNENVTSLLMKTCSSVVISNVAPHVVKERKGKQGRSFSASKCFLKAMAREGRGGELS